MLMYDMVSTMEGKGYVPQGHKFGIFIVNDGSIRLFTRDTLMELILTTSVSPMSVTHEELVDGAREFFNHFEVKNFS